MDFGTVVGIIILILLAFVGFFVYLAFKLLEFIIQAVNLYRTMVTRQDTMIKLLSEIKEGLQSSSSNDIENNTQTTKGQKRRKKQESQVVQKPDFKEITTTDPVEAVDILLNKALESISCLSQEDVAHRCQSLREPWVTEQPFEGDPAKTKDFLLTSLKTLASSQGFKNFVITVRFTRECVQIKALFSEEMFAGLLIWKTNSILYSCGNSAFHSKVNS